MWVVGEMFMNFTVLESELLVFPVNFVGEDHL